MSTGITVGSVVDGKFTVDRVLGGGTFSVVVAATPTSGGPPVALKFRVWSESSTTEAAARFGRGVELQRALHSQHFPRVLEEGRLADQSHYVTMDLLTGDTLDHIVKAEGPLAIPRAVDIAIQVCAALAEAHAQRILHRDIRPHNLFLSPREPDFNLSLLDFELGKREGAKDIVPGWKGTATYAAMGNPVYVAPEALEDVKRIGVRSELYSVGGVLYEMLVGRPPFRAPNLIRLCHKILSEPPTPLRDERPELPAELETVVLRCLAKSPDDRYASAADLAETLRPFASPFGAELAREVAARHGSPREPAAPGRAQRANRPFIAFAIVIGATLVLALAWWLAR